MRDTDWFPDHLVWEYEAARVEAPMRVSDRVLKCVVFLGLKRGTSFEPLGTGFLVHINQGQVRFQYIVTAMHVLEELKEPIAIRVNKKNGDPDYPEPPFGWYYHPDHGRYVDVAVAPIQLPPDTYDIITVPLRDFCDETLLKEHDVGVGEELFYPSLFMHHRGVGRNHPVMRFGTLAAMPIEPVRTKSGPINAYLMEGRSIGGHSGAPVFVNFMAPRDYYRDRPVMLPHPDQNQAYRLLGVLRSYLRAKDSGEYTTDERQTEDLWINSGISTIVPAQEIIDTLMQDDLVNQRKEHEKRHMDRLADVPTSGRPTQDSSVDDAPLATETNPKHRLLPVLWKRRIFFCSYHTRHYSLPVDLRKANLRGLRESARHDGLRGRSLNNVERLSHLGHLSPALRTLVPST